jgi:hypothetical protein
MSVVGLSFMASVEQRIEVTLEILLVIAALYIVIGRAIPFVGYLTLMDQFIISVFASLSFAIGCHFATSLLDESAESLPMNYFCSALIEFMFRMFWIPMTLIVFIRFFDIRLPSILISLYAVCALSLLLSVKRLKSLRRALEYSILHVFIKKERIDNHNAIYNRYELDNNMVKTLVDKFDSEPHNNRVLNTQSSARQLLSNDDLEDSIQLEQLIYDADHISNESNCNLEHKTTEIMDSDTQRTLTTILASSSSKISASPLKKPKPRKQLESMKKMHASFRYHHPRTSSGNIQKMAFERHDKPAHLLIKSLTLTWLELLVIRFCEYFFHVSSLEDISYLKNNFTGENKSG